MVGTRQEPSQEWEIATEFYADPPRVRENPFATPIPSILPKNRTLRSCRVSAKEKNAHLLVPKRPAVTVPSHESSLEFVGRDGHCEPLVTRSATRGRGSTREPRMTSRIDFCNRVTNSPPSGRRIAPARSESRDDPTKPPKSCDFPAILGEMKGVVRES